MCRACRQPLQAAEPEPVQPPELHYPPPPLPVSRPSAPSSAWEPPSEEGDDADAQPPAPSRDAATSEPPAQPLVPPPRPVPVGLRLLVLCGGVLGLMGWFFLGFGMIFVWAFGPRRLPLEAYTWREPAASASGVVRESHSTSVSVNESPVYEHAYSFRAPDGAEHGGVSYAIGRSLPAGSEVTVDYVADRPGLSQIHGMRRNVMPEWVLPLVAIFPLIGLAFALHTLRNGIRASRLLAHGQLASGVLAAKTPTNTRINGRPVYRLAFDFEAGDGRHYQATAQTHEPERLEDQRREALLYDVLSPGYSVMLDSLPGSPTIDPFGHFEAPPVGRVIGHLLVPGLAIAGHSIYLLVRLLH